MLKKRVMTAVVLLAVLLGALVQTSPIPLLLLLILIASCAAWEWLRLVLPRTYRRTAWWLAVALGVLLWFLTVRWFSIGMCLEPIPVWGACPKESRALWLWMIPVYFFILKSLMPWLVLAWCIGAPLSILYAQKQHIQSTSAPQEPHTHIIGVLHAILALAAITVLWAALMLLYDASTWLLLSLMALVWCADIAAYFTGRVFGRRKLASAVSPGKTWEGAAGGVLAAMVWTLTSAHWEGSFGAMLLERYSLVEAACLTALLAALSIVGDLYESLLKRRAGVKDSSGLLPGHGGVLDRIDALLPVAPAAYYLLHFVP